MGAEDQAARRAVPRRPRTPNAPSLQGGRRQIKRRKPGLKLCKRGRRGPTLQFHVRTSFTASAGAAGRRRLASRAAATRPRAPRAAEARRRWPPGFPGVCAGGPVGRARTARPLQRRPRQSLPAKHAPHTHTHTRARKHTNTHTRTRKHTTHRVCQHTTHPHTAARQHRLTSGSLAYSLPCFE